MSRVNVPADGFPIPVEAFCEATPADGLACGKCGLYRIATDDEIGISDLVGPCNNYAECNGWLEWAYNEAEDKCPGCNKLGWWSWQDKWPYGKACSRVCFLQAEYAASLNPPKEGVTHAA